jgi:hypothetical protein
MKALRLSYNYLLWQSGCTDQTEVERAFCEARALKRNEKKIINWLNGTFLDHTHGGQYRRELAMP